ncbi:alpha/beta hydrolase [Cutibacterium namnetense]|uniref:Alpha/beta hydrolase n=1 Tax=Cutibacterium namnetense TaxID=1574624 RepID=A0ABX9IDQ7_9ACTN|nr:alpha/beta hydrolase [Cutibacterium namnetense]TKW72775.1 MAG: alpha/beta hydrolase [Cutibacterium acnes]
MVLLVMRGYGVHSCMMPPDARHSSRQRHLLRAVAGRFIPRIIATRQRGDDSDSFINTS